MKNKKTTVRRSAPAARIVAFLLSFVLTLTLFITLCGAEWNLLTMNVLHERVSLDASVVDEQMGLIGDAVKMLAERYGFDADRVTEAIGRDTVEAMNREVTAWWTGILRTGSSEGSPVYHAQAVEETLKEDGAFLARYETYEIKETIKTVAAEIDDAVTKTVLQVRGVLMDFGLKKVTEKIDLAGLLHLMRQVPAVTGLVSLLLAGLIALLLSRRLCESLKYYGGVLGANGLLILMAYVLVRQMDPGAMIREASGRLFTQYMLLGRILTAEVLGAAAVLIALCVLLMLLYGRNNRRNRGIDGDEA